MRFLAGIIIFFIASSLWAQLPKDIELEANHIEYSNQNTRLVASNNVQLRYQNFAVSSNAFIFDSQDRSAMFPKPLLLHGANKTFAAKSLHYAFTTASGNATCLDIATPKLSIYSETAKFTKNTLYLNENILSMCSKQNPPVFLHSESVRVYPLLGVLVAKRNRLHIKHLPFSIPIPYYIYGARSYSLLGKSNFIPELGSNLTEGRYAIYRIPYILSPKFAAALTLGYSENLKWMYGGNTVYTQTNRLQHGLKYRYYPNDNITSYHHISRYRFWLWSQTHSTQNFLDHLLAQFDSNSQSFGSLSVEFQQNQLIYDYWVTHQPKLSISMSNINLLSVQHSGNLAYSKSSESQDLLAYTSAEQLMLNYLVTKPLFRDANLNLVADVSSGLNIYSNHAYWHRYFITLSLGLNRIFNPKLSYSHKLANEGKSPFSYERQYAREENEVGIQLSEYIYKIQFYYESFYSLPNRSYRTQDFKLYWLFDCWGAGFTWKNVQEQFLFSFSLDT